VDLGCVYAHECTRTKLSKQLNKDFKYLCPVSGPSWIFPCDQADDGTHDSGRSYDQYCPVARALAVLGERWTLLVVRDLLMGPKR
jgi:hypothetical protein